jgi:hypothetical protein
MRRVLGFWLLTLARFGTVPVLLTMLASGSAHAIPVAYNDLASFNAATSGYTTGGLDFDSETAGTTIPSGGSAGGFTFTYVFGGGKQLKISDAFHTTSAPNFLGTDDNDLLTNGDDFTLTFSAVNAIGLFIISSDATNAFLFDNDISLTAAGATAFLDVDNIEQTLADGANVFFLGVVDPDVAFTAALLDSDASASPNFLFNVDDIVTGIVPEPASALLTAVGLAGIAALRRRARSA